MRVCGPRKWKCGAMYQSVLMIRKLQKLSQVRKLFGKNSENRSISIDKYATASYNITIIKQNNLIKSEERRNYQLGKKGRKKDFSTKEKELLEIENLKLQKREKQASIISTIVIMIVSVITAILKWLG